jgi:hypothetical protein
MRQGLPPATFATGFADSVAFLAVEFCTDFDQLATADWAAGDVGRFQGNRRGCCLYMSR